MRRIKIVGKSFLIILFTVYTQRLFCQSDFIVYNAWDFENQTLGEFTDEEAIAYMNMTGVVSYSGAIPQIVNDSINGAPTKVFRITDLANDVWHGWGGNANIGNYTEVYCSFDWKFSNEFNSTQGGKLPGFCGLPYKMPLDGYSNPTGVQGFSAINLFNYAGFIKSYHYDNTLDHSPWSVDVDSVPMVNGTWYNITQRLVMNTFNGSVANADGIKELWIDGKLVIQEKNLKIVSEPAYAYITAFRLAHFYGGDPDQPAYIPLSQCYGYIDNIKIFGMPNDPTWGQRTLHSLNSKLTTPDPITDKTFYADKHISSAGPLKNSQYGTNLYSPCIDETWIVDAGEGNTVTWKGSWKIGGGDYIYFYDGNQTNSKILRIGTSGADQSGQTVTSKGRYMFIRFSSNTDIGSEGFNGMVSFNQGDGSEIIYNPPVIINPLVSNNAPIINDQEFLIKKAEFKNNYVGKIIASDIDAEQRLTYSIDSGNESGKFKLNNLTGEITANTTNLFSQITTTFNLTVKATDNGPDEKSSMAKVKISFLAEELSVTMITDPELMVYPNPSSGPFSVSINIPKEPELSTNDIESSIAVPKMELNVVSISGKTLLTRLLDQTGTLIQETFDLTGIPNGFYFIVLKTAYKLYTEKLIITQ